MTKLEEEIKVAMIEAQWGLGAPEDVIMDIQTKAAAEVAKRYIESLANFLIENNTGAGKIAGILRQQYKDYYQRWLKENGII